MSFLEDIRGSIDRLAVFGELDVDATALPSSATGLSDSSVREAIAETAGIIKQATMLQAVLAGVAASRSGRDRGHGGLVQESGHRNAVEFLRDVAGATRGEAIRAVKVGESLLDGASPGDGQSGSMAADAARDATPWHQPLRDALLAGTITTAQHHAIRAGLGAPPALEGRDDDTVAEVWRAAAHRLAEEARACTVEDLAARARALRDMIDPAGAEERYAAQFDKRSYRSSVDADGLRRGYIVFDPEMGVWLDDLMSAALRPRRGGPRFVADDQKRVADELENDPRTNDQLAYDLLIDVLRAGALTNAKDVYGAREPGIRLVTLKDAVTGSTAHRDAFGRLVAIACTYDGKLAIPGSVLERTMCFTGTTDVLTDTSGNPLDVGRELRLFSAKQRLTLALRDGGCLWPGCDRPPEYCEAHHCDHWADGGKTDCDRGVLLCRYHHLHLHNAGWRITRDGMGPFLLHPPASTGDAPIVLQSKSPLRWLWDPPPERARWRSAA